MFTNRFSRIFIVVLVFVTALATVSFAAHSATVPAADRSYDSIEKVRVAAVQADRSYDLIEQMRAAHHSATNSTDYEQIELLHFQGTAGLLAVGSNDEAIEQIRLGRAFNANRSYDQIETLRLSR